MILEEQAVFSITALKIDIEGAEDVALSPFLESASNEILPQLIIIENSDKRWKKDLRSDLANRGYVTQTRTYMNSIYRRTQTLS